MVEAARRYNMYGQITFRVAQEMRKPEVADFFAKLIQRTSPKSYAQAYGEVFVTTKFLENFCGDQARADCFGLLASTAGVCWQTCAQLLASNALPLACGGLQRPAHAGRYARQTATNLTTWQQRQR
jgi:hypothetical protein